jgi:hypothetical protein
VTTTGQRNQRRKSHSLLVVAPTLLVCAGVAAASCGGSQSDSRGVYYDSGADGPHKVVKKGADGGGPIGGDSGADSNAPPDACASTMKVATPPAPLDMIILLDRSGSMAYNDAWSHETQALESFFYDSRSNGIGVGLLYMPQLAICDLSAYVPAVPVSLLPAAAGALVTSLDNTRPFGGTPITLGIEGAVNAAKARQKAEPGHEVIIIYSTDGVDINSCSVVPPDGGLVNTKANAISVLTEAAAANPPIKTFVIGVNPEPQTNDFAAAGGTGQAILLDPTPDGGAPVDIEGQLISAFSAIRDQVHIPCTYAIPPASGGTINFADVNVTFKTAADAGAPVAKFYGVANAAGCQKSSADWYYDNPSDPKNIVFCPTACQEVTASTSGEVNIEFGCTPTLAPPILK